MIEAIPPSLRDLRDKLIAATRQQMTAAEIDAQRQSWQRGMTARCEHGIADFEQCQECRAAGHCQQPTEEG